MSIELWKLVVIAIIGTLSYYLRESYKKAQLKKQIAVKLKVFTSEIWESILENENLSKIIEIGILWHVEEKDIKSSVGYQEIQDKYKVRIQEISKILKEDENIKNSLKKFYDEIHNIPEGLFEFKCDKYKQIIVNLQKNNDFISNEEASLLSIHALAKVIKVRSYLESLVNSIYSLTVTARYMEPYDSNKFNTDVFNLTISAIKAGRELPKLIEIAESINKKKMFNLIKDDFLEFK